MDVLTEIIRTADLSARVFARHAGRGTWGVCFPCRFSAGFHVVLQGEAWLRGPGLAAPVRLGRGDLVLVARGTDHAIASAPDAPAVPVDQFAARPAEPGPATTAFVGAAYRFADGPVHPLLTELPPLLHLDGQALAAHHPLHAAVGLLSAELEAGRPGSEAVVDRLVDVLFHYVVRFWIDQREGGFAGALRDEALARALAAMHGAVGRPWGVSALAGAAGLSRSAFAERFKRTTGETPAGYLTKLRMQRAMQLLRGSEAGLEAIAAEVGYANAFAFSKAFKRLTGQAPGAYRRPRSAR